MTLPLRLSRRAVALAAPLSATALIQPASSTLPETATLLAPGPETAPGFRWLQGLAGGLGRALPLAMTLRVTALGGADGVTAANRFATMSSPDEHYLLALVGAALQARLLGDSRAQFDPAPWLPVCAGIQPSGLFIRQNLPANTPIRFALPGPETPAAAGLLALDLQGIPALPVVAASPEAAFRAQAADAFLASGPDLAERARDLGAQLSDPAAGLDAPPAAMAALQASLGACALRALVLLPSLTPAAVVTAFRRAAAKVAEDGGDETLLGPAEAAQLQAVLRPGAEAQSFYRDWVTRRLGLRAG